MCGRKAVRITGFVLLALSMGFLGCKGPVGPAGPDGSPGPSFIYVSAGVEGPTAWDTTSNVMVYVYNSPVNPGVEVNGIAIPFQGFQYGSYTFEDWNFPISPGDTAGLVVTYTKVGGGPGTAQGSAVLPGQFAIASHDTSILVNIAHGTGLTVMWTSSGGADAYMVDLYLDYDYIDTLGFSKSFYCDIDTFVTNTFIVFGPSELFPNEGEINFITSSWGYFDVSAITGPYQEGMDGNVTGDGVGLFYGYQYGGGLNIGASSPSNLATKKEEPRNRLQELIEERARKLNLP